MRLPASLRPSATAEVIAFPRLFGLHHSIRAGRGRLMGVDGVLARHNRGADQIVTPTGAAGRISGAFHGPLAPLQSEEALISLAAAAPERITNQLLYRLSYASATAGST